MSRATISQNPFLPAWFWLLPLTLIFLFFEALRPANDPTARIVWYAVLMIIGTTALTRVCRQEKRFDPFEPLHMTFVLFVIFYPVRALLAVWLDEGWFDPSNRASWTGLSASALGFICFALGYKLSSKRSPVHQRIWLDRSWNVEKANFVSLVFLLLGIAGFVAVRLLSGSFFYFILLDPDIKSPQDIKPWFFYLLWICLFLQVGALIQLGVWFSSGRRRLWTAFYCLLALLSTLLLARYFTVLSLMMFSVSWHYQRRRIKTFQVVIFFFLLVGYLGLAGLYREWISPGYNLDEVGELAELAGQQKQLVLHYVVGNLEELSNLCEVITMTPSELPYQFGSTFTPIILKPVPRVLMPEKPLGASAMFTQQLSPGSYDSGLVTGLGAWGEWYLNFSWLGLVFGMALTGALSSVIYRAVRATNGFSRVLLFSSCVVVLFSWLRSDFNSATSLGLYYFIPALLALAYITNAKPETRQYASVE